MTQKLILVSGMYGSGKTMYCSKFEYPLIHIDDYFNYVDKTMHYDLIEEWKNGNSQCDTLMLDAYIFTYDKYLSKLKKAISPNISIRVIYTTIDELYKCQRSTSVRKAREEAKNWSKEKHIQYIKSDQKILIDRFTGYLNGGVVTSVEYIFREDNNYTTTNKEHILKILGE